MNIVKPAIDVDPIEEAFKSYTKMDMVGADLNEHSCSVIDPALDELK